MIIASPMMSQAAVAVSKPTNIRPQDNRRLPPPESNPSSVVTLSAEAVRQSSSDAATIRYGYSADGTYFGTPAEFFASQKAHYQQLGYALTEQWMTYFTNAILHPNPEGGVIEAPPLRDGESSIKIADVLTGTDKAIIQQVSPFAAGGSGPKQINGLATIIALERAHGNLQGEIDANYVNNLKKRLIAAGSEAIPLNILDKLVAVVSAGQPTVDPA